MDKVWSYGGQVIFETTHRSRQLRLWDLTDDEWRKVYRLPLHPRRSRPRQDEGLQASFPLEMTG